MAIENDDDFSKFEESFDKKYREWEKLPKGSDEALKFLEGRLEYTSKKQSKPSRKETGSNLPGQAIYGFENETLSLKDFLLNQKESEEFKTLAIVGKYGVGKTALCQVIFNDEDVKRAYVPRVWVCMYTEEQLREDAVRKNEQRQVDRKIAILKRILKSLGVHEDMLAFIKNEAKEELEMGAEGEKELSMLLYALHLNLWGKKYLMVLDDARSEDGWSESLNEKEKIPQGKQWGTHLSCGFPKGSGGRVIVTSRDEKLAKELVGGMRNLHRLYPLFDIESVWKIYVDAARSKEKPSMDKMKYKKDVMNKSWGNPYAAITLGAIEPVDLDEPMATSSGKKGSSHGRSSHTGIGKDKHKEVKTGSSHGKTIREYLSEQNVEQKG